MNVVQLLSGNSDLLAMLAKNDNGLSKAGVSGNDVLPFQAILQDSMKRVDQENMKVVLRGSGQATTEADGKTATSGDLTAILQQSGSSVSKADVKTLLQTIIKRMSNNKDIATTLASQAKASDSLSEQQLRAALSR